MCKRPWPEGYLLAESIFCKDEETRFWKHTDMDWKDAHRQFVLDKREQFRHLWNAIYVDQQVFIQ